MNGRNVLADVGLELKQDLLLVFQVQDLFFLILLVLLVNLQLNKHVSYDRAEKTDIDK